MRARKQRRRLLGSAGALILICTPGCDQQESGPILEAILNGISDGISSLFEAGVLTLFL